jgi:SET domain-containing protein
MAYVHSELVEVRWTRKKGRGVFARRNIRKGTVIERAPVILVRTKEVFDNSAEPMLASYVFEWGKDTVAVVLGYGSLYNHSYQPNAEYYDSGRLTQVFTALRDIRKGEEITVNYNGWPGGRVRVGFRVA